MYCRKANVIGNGGDEAHEAHDDNVEHGEGMRHADMETGY